MSSAVADPSAALPLELTPHQRRGVAVEAEVSEPTVGAVLAGKPTQPSTRARVIKALVALGFLSPPPAAAPPPAPPVLAPGRPARAEAHPVSGGARR
jgi:hypothetical protein